MSTEIFFIIPNGVIHTRHIHHGKTYEWISHRLLALKWILRPVLCDALSNQLHSYKMSSIASKHYPFLIPRSNFQSLIHSLLLFLHQEKTFPVRISKIMRSICNKFLWTFSSNLFNFLKHGYDILMLCCPKCGILNVVLPHNRFNFKYKKIN